MVAADKLTDELSGVVASLSQAGSLIEAVEVDTRNSRSVDNLAAEAVRHYGKIDIWINDAGIQPMQKGPDLEDDELAEMLQANLAGVYYGARAAHLQMVKQGQGGVIINIASSVGFHGVKQQPHYVASKWGVRGLTAALAMDWGGDNVRVVAVAPGLTDTPGVEAKKEALAALSGGDIRQTTAKAYPAGRMGVPDDIARVVTFLASELATFMTGSTVLVDGGEVAAGGSNG